MLTRQQREFRKNMKQILKEKQRTKQTVPLSYYKENHHRRKYKKTFLVGGGGIALLILLWNLYAISTWFHPQQIVKAPTQVQSATPSSSMLSGLNNTQQEVSDYIQTSSTIRQKLSVIIQKLLNPNTLANVPNQTLTVTKSQLKSLQQSATTHLEALVPLRSYNLKQIELAQSALIHIQNYQVSHNPSDWHSVQQLVGQYNNNLVTEQAIIISILDKEHMPYQVDENGHVTYHYIPSTRH